MSCRPAREQIEQFFKSGHTSTGLTQHLATCDSCRKLFEQRRWLQNAIARLRAETSGVGPSPHVERCVFAALDEPGLGLAKAASNPRSVSRRHRVQLRNRAALALALSMSMVGSALVYQVAKLLTVPMHVGTAQVEAGVLIFWLLPSVCSALCLLGARSENQDLA